MTNYFHKFRRNIDFMRLQLHKGDKAHWKTLINTSMENCRKANGSHGPINWRKTNATSLVTCGIIIRGLQGVHRPRFREQPISGFDDENSYHHLWEFEKLCSCLVSAGMTHEILRWKLFCFSLRECNTPDFPKTRTLPKT